MPADKAANVLNYASDDDELTAVHAIVAGSRLITEENLEAVLEKVGDDHRHSAGIVRVVLCSTCNAVPTVVALLQRLEQLGGPADFEHESLLGQQPRTDQASHVGDGSVT